MTDEDEDDDDDDECPQAAAPAHHAGAAGTAKPGLFLFKIKTTPMSKMQTQRGPMQVEQL